MPATSNSFNTNEGTTMEYRGQGAEYAAVGLHGLGASAAAKLAVDANTPHLEQVADRIRIVTDTLAKAHSILADTTAKVFGPGLEGAGENSPQPPSASRLDSIGRAIDELDKVACGIISRAERLNTL
jgi:hypothetical protein